jgi:hypothetical protein
MSKFAALELDTAKPGRMVILHPVSRQPLKDAEGNEAYVDIYSSDSEIARKYDRKVFRARLNMRGRGKVQPEQLEAEAVGRLAALSTGWHLLDLQGNAIDVPFSESNAEALYANSRVAWLREQLDEYTTDRENFSKVSSSTSSPMPSTSSSDGS